MKLYRLLSAVLSCLCAGVLLFSSCTPTEGEPHVETDPGTQAELAPDGVPLHIPTDGKINFAGFADTGNAGTFSSDHIYTFTPLPALNENYDLTNCCPYPIDETHIALLADIHKTEKKLLIYDITDGTVTETLLPLPDGLFASEESFQFARLLADGSYLYVSRSRPNPSTGEIPTTHMFHLAADGTLLAKAALPDGYSGYNILPLSGDKYAVDAFDMVFIYDRALNLLWSENGSDAMLTPQGNLYIGRGYGGSYVRFDTENYTSTSMHPFKASNFRSGAPTLYFSGTASAYDAYLTSPEGFWGMREGDTEATLLCAWQDSGVKYGDLTILSILDEHTVFATLDDPFSDTGTVYGIFAKARETQKSKTVITLGIVDNIAYRPSNITLIDAVNRFNATNKDYYVDLVRYVGMSNDYQDGSIPDAFTEAMLSDTAADIIVSSDRARENMQIYREKGAFTDLSSAVSDVLIPAAVNAYRQNDGSLYAIPMNMELSVLAIKDFFVGDEEHLTLDEVYSLQTTARENGICLSNAASQSILRAIAAPSFSDSETGECWYNTPEFASFIEFYETYPTLTPDDDHRIVYAYSDYYLQSPDIPSVLHDDGYLVVEMPFSSMRGYALLKQLYRDEGFSLHGYPADGDEIVYLQSELDFSINASSGVQYGALSFLAFLLSDDIQSSTTLTDTALPVTYSGCELLLEERTYYFDRDLYRIDDYFLGCRINCWLQESAEFYLNSESESLRNRLQEIAVSVTLTDDDIAALRRLFYTSETRSLVDTTMQQIIEEELSAYRAGAQTLERTQEILQSRLFIYVNE